MSNYNNELLSKLEESGVDMKSVLSRFVNNEDLCVKFMLKFLEDKTYNEIINAFNELNYENLLVGVHTLKGVSGNLGMTKLYDSCANVVSKIRNNDYSLEKDIELIKSNYGEIVEVLNLFK